MKINAIKCNSCGDTIYSRALHDFRWCSCKGCAIDGGLDYIRVVGENYKMEDLNLILTRKQLYEDWNSTADKLGVIKNED